MKKIFRSFCFLLLLPQFVCASDYLTGDWNGVRQRAHIAGVDFFLKYGNDIAVNPSGGYSQGWAQASSFDGGIRIDGKKTANIPGLSLYTSFSWPSGTSLTNRYIHNQFSVQQLYGGETLRLAELYIQESLFNEKFHLKCGRLCAGNDFLISPLFLFYVTSAINGIPIAIEYNIFFSGYPYTSWGAYLDFQISSLLFKFGVYDNNVKTWLNKYHGINFTFQSRQGVTFITEWAYLLSRTLPGNYKIGAYYVTEEHKHTEIGPLPSNYGFYFLFDQMFKRWNKSSTITQGLTAWGTFLYAPSDRNSFPFFFSSGLIAQGPLDSRPDDALCFGISYGHYSSNIKHPMIIPVNRSRRAETQLELNYNIQAANWLILTPVMQYVICPQGLSSIPNAYVLGIQIEIDI